MTREEDVPELRESQPNASGPQAAAGGMGVSSEREAINGDDPRPSTDGTKDTSVKPTDHDDPSVPPEQAPGQVEQNAEGLAPKAGYPRLDPRSGS